MRPAAVLWDLDGTLIDGEGVWEAAHRDVARELGVELTEAQLHGLIGVDLATSVSTLADAAALPATPGVTRNIEDRLISAVADGYADGVPWLPGAHAALTAVRATGLRTALVTNTVRSLTDLVLDHIGREHFDVTVCADEVAAGKPAPDPYRRAAELLDVDPATCVAVEDSTAGIASALIAGAAVLTVWPPGYLDGFATSDLVTRTMRMVPAG